MKCDGCGANSDKIAHIDAKVSCAIHEGISFNGRSCKCNIKIPKVLGIGTGSHLQLSFCIVCGKIQGNFPKKI